MTQDMRSAYAEAIIDNYNRKSADARDADKEIRDAAERAKADAGKLADAAGDAFDMNKAF